MIQQILRKALVSTVLAGYLLWPASSSANAAVSPDLVIAQAKVTTSGQLISLYNNSTETIDMSSVVLQYFNNYQLAEATSTKTIQLSGNLPARSYYTINDGPLTLCYKTMIHSASMGFSTKSGLVQVVRLSQSANGIDFSAQDFVAWSSTSVAGAQTMPPDPAFLQRQMSGGKPVTGGTWQLVKPSNSNACELVTTGTGSVIAPSSQLLPATPPPARIVSTLDSGGANKNAGLMKPQLTELLPNPASPQTDSQNEFVEVYNANSARFDLSGYKLQTISQSGSKRTYTFSAGTVIAGRSFAAYPSANITISLNNSGSTVWLLDPNDKVISQTDAYGKAEDGQAWALANGKWYWTTTPTPNKANEINGETSQAKNNQGTGTVRGASTFGNNKSTTGQNDGSAQPRNLNSAVLVGVGVLAVVYGLYEYRRDLANRIQKFKRNRAVRRENRPKT